MYLRRDSSLFTSPLAPPYLPIRSYFLGMTEKIIAPETIICSEGDQAERPDLRILHFNDGYHVEPSIHDPAGGITRFQTMCNYYRQDPKFQGQPELLSFFSGDGFNPSLESSVTKGLCITSVKSKVY